MKNVSIIVPVYNVEKYLSKCLDSLVNQTLDNIEIIIVNDGSLDNSQLIIDDYEKKYPNKIKALKQKNRGQGSARNHGFKYATGEYIGYVDSDDYVENDMYEKMYSYAKKSGYDIVSCLIRNVKENGIQLNSSRNILKTGDKLIDYSNDIGVCNKIFKKDKIKNIKFKEKLKYEDLAFTCKAIIESKKIGFIDQKLYNYLFRNGSTMNNNYVDRNLEIIPAFDDLLEYVNKNNIYDDYYQQIEFLAIYHIYISALVRIINIKSKCDKNNSINTLINYMDDKFKNYHKNKYIYLLNKNKKLIYFLIRRKKFYLIKLIFIVKEMVK